jgi:TonB family protein
MSEASVVDSTDAAVEVVILWGELSTLHVSHLSPPRDFSVGEAAAADFLIGSEILGTERLPIVVVQGSSVAVAVPGTEQLMPLPLHAATRFEYRGFTFVVKHTTAARRVGAGQSRTLAQHTWTLASMVAHLTLLLLFQLLPPHSSALSIDLINADSRLISYLDQPPATLNTDKPKWLEEDADADGGSGKSHQGDDGQLGKPEQPSQKRKYAIKGPAQSSDPHMARDVAKQAAESAGIIGVMRQNVGAWSSPNSTFGRDTASARDLSDAIGALMGDQIGASFGFNGLGMRGHGRGGGGTGEGSVGVGDLGTLGHGRGRGEGDGIGQGAGQMHGRVSRVPRIRSEAADIHGALAKEVIRRVIGRHISEVRFCYQAQLNAHPDLQGRVTVKFVIAPTGAVQAAASEKSDLGNAKVEQCIAQAVRRWSFPAPEGGGIVVVSYPFLLSQVGN